MSPARLPGAPFADSLAVRTAARAQAAIVHGLTVGLTDAECREVIEAWAEYHYTRTSALRWAEVKRSMTLRAMGEDWRP